MLTIREMLVFWIVLDFPYLIYRMLELSFRIRRKAVRDHPLVSILIPAYNEENCIAKTLKSCMHQSYPRLEIIVIDDGSTDNTSKVIEAFRKQNLHDIILGGIKFIHLVQKNGGKSTALNFGLGRAKGEFIVTIDADSYLSHRAIERAMLYFTGELVGSVAGNIIGISRHKILDYIQYIEYELGILFLKKAQSFTHDVMVTPGAFSVYRKSVLKKFETGTITEDFDTSVRIIERGYGIVEAVDAICYTQLPMDVSDLIKQRIRWQEGGLQVLSKHLTHEKRIFAHIEMFLIFFFGFYGVFPRFLSLLILPVMLLSGASQVTAFLAFFVYSMFVLFVQFLMLYRHLPEKKMFLYLPAFFIYSYTIILYSCVMAQILIFKNNVGWSKLSRYRM